MAAVTFSVIGSSVLDRLSSNLAARDSPTAAAFRLMYRVLTDDFQRQSPGADVDKIVSKTLHLVGDHFMKPGSALTWTTITELLRCSVDDVSGVGANV